MYKKIIEALYQEKDGRPVIASILNCNETTEQGDIKQRGTKRKRNQPSCLRPIMTKPS